jgi:hypothetical protein
MEPFPQILKQNFHYSNPIACVCFSRKCRKIIINKPKPITTTTHNNNVPITKPTKKEKKKETVTKQNP